MSSDRAQKNSPCTQILQDMARATYPKNDSFREVTCSGCGKIFWTNSNKEFCFDCKQKTNSGSN